jgi:hypothetical protein
VGTRGYSDESVKATAYAFDVSGADMVHEAASAVAELVGLHGREIAGLPGGELEQPLELVRS